jgi:F0F1-type ATP synthase assembly protein I
MKTNNDGRDIELDKFLNPLKVVSPNDSQIQKWQLALQKEVQKKSNIYSTSKTKWAFQLVAAMLIGIVIGALVSKSYSFSVQQPREVAQNYLEDATFERSHDNLD